MLQKKLKVKDIDLLDAYKKKKEPSKYAALVKFVIPPVVLALLIGSIFGFLTLRTFGLNNDIKDTNTKIKQLENKIANDPDLAKSKTLQGIVDNSETYKKLYEDIQSYPQLSQGTFDQLIIAADGKLSITAFSYSRESQIISVSIETSNERNTELFVRNLKASDEFAAVTYAGYAGSEKNDETGDSTVNDAVSDILGGNTQENKTVTKETVYRATVLCTLK